jgi:hypothetical protein
MSAWRVMAQYPGPGVSGEPGGSSGSARNTGVRRARSAARSASIAAGGRTQNSGRMGLIPSVAAGDAPMPPP